MRCPVCLQVQDVGDRLAAVQALLEGQGLLATCLFLWKLHALLNPNKRLIKLINHNTRHASNELHSYYVYAYARCVHCMCLHNLFTGLQHMLLFKWLCRLHSSL